MRKKRTTATRGPTDNRIFSGGTRNSNGNTHCAFGCNELAGTQRRNEETYRKLHENESFTQTQTHTPPKQRPVTIFRVNCSKTKFN